MKYDGLILPTSKDFNDHLPSLDELDKEANVVDLLNSMPRKEIQNPRIRMEGRDETWPPVESWPPNAGTQILQPGDLFGFHFFDPSIRLSCKAFLTNRPYYPHAIEVVVQYDSNLAPKLVLFDWGIKPGYPDDLTNPNNAIGFVEFDQSKINSFFFNLQTPYGNRKAVASITGYSKSENRHVVYLHHPTEKKWFRVYGSTYLNPISHDHWSHGYSQLELFPSAPNPHPRIGIGFGVLGLQIFRDTWQKPTAPKCFKASDHWKLPHWWMSPYKKMVPESVLDSWGYSD